MGIEYFGIKTGKFRRYHSSKILNIIDPTTLFKNGADVFRFLAGIKESRNILMHEKPDIVFAKGGYVSLPAAIAAWTLRIPVVTHESDAVMGMANRHIARFAKKVCVSFPTKVYSDVQRKNLIETGNPVRDDIMMGDGIRYKSEIGFSEDKKTILIIGGSQGSLFINELVLEIIEELILDYQVLWIAGERDADFINYRLKNMEAEKKKRVKVYGFVTSEIADIYAASDLAVSRSGSNAIFELAALGKPAIFIPHDVSPGGHQFENAKIFSRAGAGFLMNQKNVTPKKLLHQIKYILEEGAEQASMSESIKKMAVPDAADKVAKVVLEIGEKSIEQARKTKG